MDINVTRYGHGFFSLRSVGMTRVDEMAEAHQIRPAPVSLNDSRLAVMAILIAGEGKALGQATILSGEIAVTTAEVAQYGTANLSRSERASLHAGEALGLAFPQFRGSADVMPLASYIAGGDEHLGFAVVRFSGIPPEPVPSDLLGNGEVPLAGTTCDLLYADPTWSQFLQLTGQIEGRSGDIFQIRLPEGSLDEPASTALVSAPVFAGNQLIGMAVGASTRPGPLTVDVLSVGGMARSAVTSAVRELLPFLSEPNVPRSGSVSQSREQISERLTAEADRGTEGPVAFGSDAEIFGRLSESGRRVLERAYGMRTRRQTKIHMELLLAALFDDWKGFFGRSKIDENELRKIIKDTVKLDLPRSSTPNALKEMPPLSAHVRESFMHAARYADTRGAKNIWSTHLLYGALSVSDCRLIKALNERGVRREDIRREDGPERDLPQQGAPAGSAIVDDTSLPPIPPFPPDRSSAEKTVGHLEVAPTAAPTPKVESDMWSEQDRLGYEAYARTIAALITHQDTKAPLTIGIKAPWGAGKTSLMKRVQHLLDGRSELSEENRSGARQQGQAPKMTLWKLRSELKKITKADRGTLKAAEMPKLPAPSNTEGERYELPPRVTVWFNAWKYQTSEQIWAGMAHCIISQVTARMTPLERELFWVRLHARRINTDEVRRKVHELLLRAFAPVALIIVVACGIVIWGVTALHFSLPLRWTIQGVTGLSGLIGLIWKARDTIGEKAAGTMKDLVREPDYEGKMGYLHLVESDIREVLNLVTAAGSEPKSPPYRTEGEKSATQDIEEKLDPLVVFVDDLDRCAPNKVAEVVEAINLFLCGDYRNCIFVLGMEPGMVAAALEVANKDVIQKAKEMGVVDSTAPVGWRFMEKIIQMPIMIPPPTKGGRDTYVTSLLGAARSPGMDRAKPGSGEAGLKAVFQTAAPGVGALPSPSPTASLSPAVSPARPEPPKEEDVKKYAQQMTGSNLAEVEKRSLEIVAAAPAAEKPAAAEAGKRAYAQAFSERDPMIANFVQECADLVDGNPRQIKRYVNVFRFYSTLRYGLRADGVATESEMPNDKVLAKFVSLSIQWPHAMDCLRGKHHLEKDGKVVTRLEYLEGESAKIQGDDTAGDAAWKEIVGDKGMGLDAWAQARAFRMFLARGESLGKSGGHGLW